MQDPATAEVHVITAQKSNSDDSARRARRDPAHAKRPRRGHPFPFAQRHKKYPRPDNPSRLLLRVVISRIQRLSAPVVAEVLDDLFGLSVADFN